MIIIKFFKIKYYMFCCCWHQFDGDHENGDEDVGDEDCDDDLLLAINDDHPNEMDGDGDENSSTQLVSSCLTFRKLSRCLIKQIIKQKGGDEDWKKEVYQEGDDVIRLRG